VNQGKPEDNEEQVQPNISAETDTETVAMCGETTYVQSNENAIPFVSSNNVEE
jgi:hypothetical protein